MSENLKDDILNVANASAKATVSSMQSSYNIGYRRGARDFADKLKKIYTHKCYDRPNAHTLIGWLFNNIDSILTEMEKE